MPTKATTSSAQETKIECRSCGANRTTVNMITGVHNTICIDCIERMKGWAEFTVTFRVAPCWVADGFNLTDERALEMLSNDLQYATISEELDAQVIAAPTQDELNKIVDDYEGQ